MRSEPHWRWVAAAAAVGAAIALIDAVATGTTVFISFLVAVPLIVSLRAQPRTVAFATVYAGGLALLLGVPDHFFLTGDHFVRIGVVVVGGLLAVWASSLRERAETAEKGATFVAEAGTRLDTSLDYLQTVNTLARIAVPWLADWCAIHEISDGTITQVAVVHGDESKEKLAWDLDRRYPFHPLPNVVETRSPELFSEIDDSLIDAVADDDEHARMLRALGLESAMLVPLEVRGRMIGVMSFATAESGRRFDESHLALAENLAERAALAIDNARLYTELQEAQGDLHRSRDEVEAVLQNVGTAIIARDVSGRFVYANDAAVEMLRFPSIDALLSAPGGTVVDRFELFDEDGNPFPLDDLPGRRTLAGGAADETIVRFRERATGDEHWASVRATPILDEQGKTALVISVFDDVTESKRRELAQRFLADSSKLLSGSLDFETTLDNVAHLAVPSFADWCAVDLLEDDGSIRNVAVAHSDPSKIALAEELRSRYPVDPNAEQGMPRVIRTGEAELYAEIDDAQVVATARDEHHVNLLRQTGIGSAMVAPMVVGGRAIGGITFASARPGRFGEEDLALAQELARRAGTAVQNARLYAERSHIARTLQRSLLPPILPDIPGVEIAARFRPAGEGYDVGGDFYDVFDTGDRGWGIVIGDVCGKGPEAASLTALARYTIRATAMQESDPHRILELLSEAIMREQSDSQFCTAAYARLEPKASGVRLTIACGGHPLPFLLTGEGKVEQVGVPGTLLGLIPETNVVDQTIELEPGSCLVFYTDGVIEAGRPRGAFGTGGLKALLETSVGLGAQEVAERIDRAVVSLDENQPDDVAVLVLRVRE